MYINEVNTVKLIFFACPLFRDPDEFAKITGCEYSNIFICISSASKNAKIKGAKII